MDHRTHIVAMGMGLEIAMASASTATAQTTSAHLSATDGNAASLGTGIGSAAVGSVTRP